MAQFGIDLQGGHPKIATEVNHEVEAATEAGKAAPIRRWIYCSRRLRGRTLGMAALTYREAVARGIAGRR